MTAVTIRRTQFLYLFAILNTMRAVQRSIDVQQSTTSVINGRLTQQGGGFSLNGELFDGYEDVISCNKFRDIEGQPFDPIKIYHAVTINASATLYVSTDKGLFLYNGDTGKVTALSYELTDMVFIILFHYTNYPNGDTLAGFYPLYNADETIKGYGLRNISFDDNGILTYVDMEGVLIPSDVTWLTTMDGIDNSITDIYDARVVSVCYKGTDIWFLVCGANQQNRLTIERIDTLTMPSTVTVTCHVNRNTLVIDTGGTRSYFVVYSEQTFTPPPTDVASVGIVFSCDTAYKMATVYGQQYKVTNGIGSTFTLITDDTGLLSVGYIIHASAWDYGQDNTIYNVSSVLLNGGYVRKPIKHRLYAITDESGYTDGNGDVYATHRYIFASSTKLMDINYNPFAALMYFRGEDTNTYSTVPSGNKTPINMTNASIDIDSQKYGNVIATNYDSVKGIYYIYTDSHIGTYFIATMRLTWAVSDIMARSTDIWSVGDITVIDGEAKEFSVNGINTTTTMHGPTFNRLYAEIEELRRRIIALENK